MLSSKCLLLIVVVCMLLEEISAVALRSTFRNKRVGFNSSKEKWNKSVFNLQLLLLTFFLFSVLRKLVHWIRSCAWMIRWTSQWVAQWGQAVKLFNWRAQPCQSTSTSTSTSSSSSVKPMKRGKDGWPGAISSEGLYQPFLSRGAFKWYHDTPSTKNILKQQFLT